MMGNQYITLRLSMFQGKGKDDVEQHWFTCREIWCMKRITDEEAKIMKIETTFKKKSLMWYMNYLKATALAIKKRSLTKLRNIFSGNSRNLNQSLNVSQR
jgi:hypothetical protein